jgi:hypothetical protein
VIGLVAEWLALPAATWVTAGTGLVADLIFLLLMPETLTQPDQWAPFPDPRTEYRRRKKLAKGIKKHIIGPA